MSALSTAVRKAIVSTLLTDSQLVSLLGGPYVFHRYVRQKVKVPSITYYDATDHQHPRLPIFNMAVTIDVWDRMLDDAEIKAQRVIQVLDVYEAEANGTTPFAVTTGEVNWGAMYLDNELDNIAPDDSGGDIARKTLLFRLQGFAVAA